MASRINSGERKIYFCRKITDSNGEGGLYNRLIELLKKYGTVLNEHVGPLTEPENLPNKKVHDRDVEWVQKAEYVVAEVTQTSLGVGYEIGRAAEMKKKILCLFQKSSGKKLSAMIEGAHNEPTFIVKHYEEEEAKLIFDEFFG